VGRGWVRPYLTLYVNAIVSTGDNEIDKIGVNLINMLALTYNVTKQVYHSIAIKRWRKVAERSNIVLPTPVFL
jgi:hypothetical protein